jgi:hypothetical protein
MQLDGAQSGHQAGRVLRHPDRRRHGCRHYLDQVDGGRSVSFPAERFARRERRNGCLDIERIGNRHRQRLHAEQGRNDAVQSMRPALGLRTLVNRPINSTGINCAFSRLTALFVVAIARYDSASRLAIRKNASLSIRPI